MSGSTRFPDEALFQDLFSAGTVAHGGKHSVPVEDVRRILGLPPIPYGEVLGPECWLAGGRVLRWLAGGGAAAGNAAGDYDLFFSSLDALNETARTLLDEGFSLTAYQCFPRTIRELNQGSFRHDAAGSPLYSDTAHLEPITPQLCRELGLAFVELNSPGKDVFQLICTTFPDPLKTLLEFDFTICQFAVDDRNLTFGPRAPKDLVDRRLRVHRPKWPSSLIKRLRKFQSRGFRPTTVTFLYVYTVACLWKSYAHTRLTLETLTSK